jgi:hypothetical protein
MSGTIKKIQSLVNFPKSRYDNQIYFHVGKEDSHIDMKASYVELEVEIPSLANYRNLVLGQSGMMYNSSALFRDASLKESGTGSTISDLLYVNILSNNLEYYSKGANNVVADALFDGKGHASFDNNVVSVFNNQYEDYPSPVIRCPLSLLYPGSVGQSDLFPQNDDLTFRFLMEPQFSVFMRAVKNDVYQAGGELLAADANGTIQNTIPCASVTANTAVVTPSATGVVANFAQGDRVLVKGLVNNVAFSGARVVASTTADNGNTPGTITLTMGISSTYDLTGTSIIKLAPFAGTVNANDLNVTGKVLTLNGTKPASALDITKDTVCNVVYTSINANGVQTLTTVQNKVDTVAVTNNLIDSITFIDNITVPTRGTIVNISVQPLYTNITADWSLTNAHLILYRRKVAMAHQSKMLMSNFSSVNVAMVGGLNRFQYSLKAENNTYNCYVFTPDGSNLLSTADGLQDYLISIDDVPLTSIYVNSTTSIHKDNLLRVFGNSPYYQPKSIVSYRDKEIANGFEPTMFVGKVFHSLMKGEPQVLPFEHPDRNIKVELVAADGKATPTKNVYVFLEKWAQN